ncbi:cytochrome P450 1A1-like isoform X2 [Lingula anatina]|uniref:Cytochrome P450 1A1-like isoform X2 n=1 Tax=Lingula anatina TaxID=7574 RepID=A0A1S3HC01_LINAN|nr:cytochrome P450 1A1-like isoform X2 [Lingula anatina]|eukprot:XP_013383543.1 cytochrome P450 1A1-like isoform X2 [Lingula anatina]
MKHRMMDTAIINWLPVKTALVGIIVFLLVMSYLQRKQYKMPPGPPHLPILGHYFAFRNDGRLYAVFNKLGKSFDDIFTVNLGFGRSLVVLKSAEIVHEALVEKKEIFAGRDDESWKFELLTDGFKDLTFASYGPVWRLQRQMTLRALGSYLASDKLETYTRSAFEEVAALIEKEAEPFELDLYIRLLVFNIVCRMSFGKSYAIDGLEFTWLKNKIGEFNEKVLGGLIPSDVIPVLKHFPIPSSLTAKRLSKELDGFFKVKLEEHKATLNTGDARDIMDQFLLLKEELTPESDDNAKEALSDTRIMLTLLDINFAATVTTSDTLNWMVMYVADNPKVQTKIHKELDDLENNLGDLRHCRTKMTYCEAVLREVMRIRPGAPVALRHKTRCDTKLGGYDIPKDTLVYPNIWAIHHDPKNWESPETFMPERFLDKDGSLKKLDKKTWLPFGRGKRKCVGEALARAEIGMIMALFFRRFSVSFPPDVQPDFEPMMFEIHDTPFPQKIIVQKRE